MGLTTQQQILIEQRVTNEAKSTGAAYLIWFFLGYLGVHRFYFGKTGSGIAMLILTVLGFLTAVVFVGFVFLLAVGIWWLVDAFLIPGWVDAQKSAVRASLTNTALIQGAGSD